jgi:hypothetical protein
MSRARDTDDIRPLLEDLQETLSTLQSELDERETVRRPPRRPPSPGEFFRFTEEYTIPTLVSLLETTIRSLELLGGVIRLLDPERPLPSADQSASRERVARGASTALSELRRALTEVDLPPEGEARDIVADARRLSADLERRIGEYETGGTSGRGRGPVSIDVKEQSASEDGRDDAAAGDEARDDGGASVDVESELDSIRREVHGSDDGDESGRDSRDGTAASDTDAEEGT